MPRGEKALLQTGWADASTMNVTLSIRDVEAQGPGACLGQQLPWGPIPLR